MDEPQCQARRLELIMMFMTNVTLHNGPMTQDRELPLHIDSALDIQGPKMPHGNRTIFIHRDASLVQVQA